MPKLSKTGKPLCGSCRRLATHRLDYISLGLAGPGTVIDKTRYAYSCGQHATDAFKEFCSFCPPDDIQEVENGFFGEEIRIKGKRCCAACYDVEHIDDEIDYSDNGQEPTPLSPPTQTTEEITTMQDTKTALTPGWMNDEYCWTHSEPYGGWSCMPCRILRWCESFSQFLLVVADAVYDRTGLMPDELTCIEIEFDPDNQTWRVECEGWWIYIEALFDCNGDTHFEVSYSLDMSDYE